MHKIFLTSLIALGFSMGSTSFAQETTTGTTEEAPTAQGAETQPTSAEDQTFPVAEDAENIVGREFIKEEHGDWKTVCVTLAEGQAPSCRLFQLLKDENGGAVAEISVIALKDAKQAVAGVNFITPLGTLLTAQASMRIDSGKVKRYPFNWCEQKGCITRFGLTKAELGSLKKGNKAVMTIASAAAPKNPIPLHVSLTGFTAAWTALLADQQKKAE
jgi:invasion protein IalB